MANQKVVKIVNIKQTISKNKRFEQNMMETLWLKKEDELRARGWLPISEIKEIKTETVEDGKGSKTVEIVEETEIVEVKDYSEMTIEELRSECEAKGIKYHKASKEAKLIVLLTQEENI